MRTIAAALAVTILSLSPVGTATPASAGIAAPSVSAAITHGGNTDVQEVRHEKRAARYERRMRKERRVRHERRAERRCFRNGRCSVVYVLIPVYYTVPVWYNAPIYYHHYGY